MKKILSTFWPLVLCVVFFSAPLEAQDRNLGVVGKQATGRSDFDIGRQYAVIIGIDRYKEWPALRNAVSEAKAVRKALSERYFIDQFFELYDEDATAIGIRRLFTEALPDKISAADSLLVFYAGHGQMDKSKTGFWIASDGSADQLGQNNWIANAQLRNMIGGLKAQRILVLADACFSGDFLNVNRGAKPKVDEEYRLRSLQLTARQVLTSGASESVPDDSEFGKQLVNLLERNTEPILDPVTMYDFVRRGVTRTLPLLGTLPDHQEGAGFALFLRSGSIAGTSAKADLLVRAEAGAEIFVDGVSRGAVPQLLKGLDSGRPLKILVRTASLAGSVQVTLAPGELRELTVPLSPLTGNLYVSSNMAAVNLWIDGVDKGPLGAGVVKGIAVGAHELELKGADLYAKIPVTVSADTTTEVSATVLPVGSVSCDIPEGVQFSIEGASFKAARIGSASFENVPAGRYLLSAGGNGFYETSTTVAVEKGVRISWKPFVGGAISFAVSPAGARYVLDGGAEGSTSDLLKDVVPGRHTIVLRKPGYKDATLSLDVAFGKASLAEATLERFAPAKLTYPDFGIGLSFDAPGAGVRLLGSADGKAAFEVNSRMPVKLVPSSSYAERLDVPAVEATFVEGEERTVEIPSGWIELPWLAEGSTVSIGSAKSLPLENIGGPGFRSRPLPVGKYTVAVSGLIPIVSRVTVLPGASAVPDGYRAAVKEGWEMKRGELAAADQGKAMKRDRTVGMLFLGLGAVAATVSASAYINGRIAYADYQSAENTPDTASFRAKAEVSSVVTQIAGAFAGAGFLGSSLFAYAKPYSRSIERQINELDRQINLLAGAK